MKILGGAKIGDTILQEPAIAAYARRTGVRPKWCLDDRLRPLFAGHPDIDVTDDPTGGIELSCMKAFEWAVSRGRYFSEGYWHQLGLDGPAEGERTRIKVPALPSHFADPRVVLCPFCDCCRSREGGPANVCPPAEWWSSFYDAFGGSPVVLGREGSPKWDWPNVAYYYGFDLLHVLADLTDAKVVVSVETGLLHLASAVTDRIVFLSTATPQTLCVPPGATWKVIRAATPYDFDAAEVVAAVRSFL